MNDYPFITIFINNREVTLAKIVSGDVIAQSDFEMNTFSFIRDWLRNEKEFYQRTSGSTGIPKKISIRREQMIASSKLTEEALQLKAGFVALVCLDTQYIAGKMMLVRCFVTGMQIVAINPVANPLKDAAATLKIDFAAFVPYQIQEIISSDSVSILNTIQTVIIGGAPLDRVAKEMVLSLSCQCYATYGMTETISHIALQKLNGPNRSEYFQLLPGFKIKLDGHNCLIINSPYLKDEVDTNDIVEMISPIEFKWVGRYDHVINSGGFKISPEKLEVNISNIFNKLEINRSFFISGYPDKRWGEKIVLIIEGEDLSNDVVANIKIMFKHYFPVYEIPKEILFRKVFLRTDSGKLNRIKTIEFYNQ